MDHALTPADLSRELGVPQYRIRAFLRRQYGTLPPFATTWILDDDKADAVRAHFVRGQLAESEATDAQAAFSTASTTELLGQYAGILSELRERGVVRTGNAPLGDYAEFIAHQVYGGILAPNSAKSYDIEADDGRRIQVKARVLGPRTSGAAVFSAFRSFDFDVATFVVLDAADYSLRWAREVAPADIEAAARWSSHINARLLRVSLAERLGTDVTDRFAEVLAAS